MFVVSELQVGEQKLPVVPKSAVRKDEAGSAHLFVVVDNHVQERLAQLGGDKADKVGVVVGMKPGEKVVVKPGADVHDGALVR
jgi:hypothetical protein